MSRQTKLDKYFTTAVTKAFSSTKEDVPKTPMIHGIVGGKATSMTFIDNPLVENVGQLLPPSELKKTLIDGKKECACSNLFAFAPGTFFSISKYKHEAQLRIFRYHPTEPQTDAFPRNLSIILNKKEVKLPDFIPSIRPKQYPLRKPEPIDVTPLINGTMNILQVSWVSDAYDDWVLGIWIIKRKDIETLAQSLITNNSITYEKALYEIAKKFDDSQCIITSYPISLRCPISKLKMDIPCRTKHCKHIACFDLITHLKLCERAKNYRCPICRCSASKKDIIVDGFLMRYFKELDDNVEEITVNNNGFIAVSKLEGKMDLMDDIILNSNPPKEILDEFVLAWVVRAHEQGYFDEFGL